MTSMATEAEAPISVGVSERVATIDLEFPFWEARRRSFHLSDPFFASGNVERELLAKHVALDLMDDGGNRLHDMDCMDDKILSCPIVGCGSRLQSLEDFEDHYRARHAASCSVCSRVYPTSRLLSIHVSEAHDSFFQAKVARGFPMYECLVEGCVLKFSSYKSRQQHLVDKHKFPTSFEFLKKAHPSKHRRQKHHLKQPNYQVSTSVDAHMDMEISSCQQDQGKHWSKKLGHGKENTKEMGGKQQCRKPGHVKESRKEMEVDAKMEDLVSAVSRLSTSDSTPSSVSFGHRRNRGFTFLPRSVQRNKTKADAAGSKSGL